MSKEQTQKRLKEIRANRDLRRQQREKRIQEGKESVPDVYEIIEELEAIRYDMEVTGDESEVDVRLQVGDGYWNILSGDASYDTDHHGSWAASVVDVDDGEEMLLTVAEDLINEVLDGLGESKTRKPKRRKFSKNGGN